LVSGIGGDFKITSLKNLKIFWSLAYKKIA
jgi:hypothetical protein